MTVLEASSQNIDTSKVWIPRKDALGTIARVERLKADSAELVIRKTEIIDLNAVVTSQRTSITNLANHVQTLDLRINNYEMQTDVLTRALKKQKRKTILSTIAGVIVSGGLAFLLVTK